MSDPVEPMTLEEALAELASLDAMLYEDDYDPDGFARRIVARLAATLREMQQENADLKRDVERLTRKPLVTDAFPRDPAPCWHDFTTDLTVNFCRKCGARP